MVFASPGGYVEPPNSCNQDFDGVPAPALPTGWTSAASGAGSVWVTSTTAPDSGPNDAFALDATELGETYLYSPVYRIASSGGQFSFKNLYNLEATANSPIYGFDGMVLEIRINSGSFQDIVEAGGTFVSGGYTRTIAYGFDSPIALRQAWSGLSGGTSTEPAYITTVVNLPPSANGQNVQLMWRVATDTSLSASGTAGVRIDTITGIQCESSTPTPSPTPTGSPTLGNYSAMSMQLSTDAVVTPDVPPANTSRINVSTDTNFKGTLTADPTTASVHVTDAHPAGTFTISVRGTNGIGVSVTRTFSLTVTTPATCNPPTFTTATFGGGSYPTSVTVGDVNNDGKQDVISANQTVNNVSVRIGNGDGSFGAPANFPTGAEPYAVAIGDFNGDGNQDLAVATYRSAGVSILLGNGAGGFGNAVNIPVGSFPYALAVGDFNNDGNQDLAVANSESANVSILSGNGDGSFGAATNFGAGTRPHSIAIGDFNSDGNQDLAVANYNSNNVSILIGNGAGTFGTAVDFAVGNQPNSIAVGDFNSDGKQDFVTANYDFNHSNNVSVRLGNGDGSFGGLTNLSTGESVEGIAIGDFNGDGKQDLAIANGYSSILSILLGNGAGGFGQVTNFGYGEGGESEVAVGDFNGDGRQDLALINFYQNTVTIFQRFCGPTPTATATPDTVSVTIPYVGSYGSTATVPILVTDLTGFGITHYEMAISFTKGAGPFSVDTSGTLSSGMSVTTNMDPFGHFVISATGTTPLAGSGTLIKTNWGGYEPSPNHGSLLEFQDFIDYGHNYYPGFRFNQGFPPVALTNGGVSFFNPTQTNTATPSATPTNTATPGGSPVTHIVTKTADTNDGVCDSDCSLREAVGAVVSGDTVAFSPLFDSPQTITLALGQIVINTNLTINGPGPDLLTISANLQGRIFNVWGNLTDVTISGMKLRDGKVGSDPGTARGGAILVENGNGSINISNVEFTNNSAFFAATPYPYGDGTAVFCYGCAMTLDNVNAHHNGDTGCAIEAYGPFNITNSVVSYNACGVYASPALNMQNTTVQGNTGFGIASYNIALANSQILGNGGRGVEGGNGLDTSVTIDNSNISGNHEYGVDNNGVTTIRNSVISNNIGSGILNWRTMYILNSAITGNRGGYGGGIYSYSSSAQLYVTNSTISGNLSYRSGGGIYVTGDSSAGKVVLVNSTVSNNQAYDKGGGIRRDAGGSAFTSSIRNSIIAGNVSLTTPHQDISGDFHSQGINLIGNAFGSTGWIAADLLGIDPLLEPLADNGGNTLTHALSLCSPAKNAGDSSLAVDPQTQQPLAVDQRGFARILGSSVDVGAFEAADEICPASTATATATATPAPGCDQSFDNVVTPVLPPGWTSTASGSEFTWFTSATNPDAGSNDAYGPGPAVVANVELISPVLAIPPSGASFSFRNLFNMEGSGLSGYDGMVLELSINGGPYRDIRDAGGSFTAGGYTSSISTCCSNPLGGRLAWSGLSGGTRDEPTYITTTVNLPAAANGQNIQLKWRIGTDDYAVATGSPGVRIDSISGLPCIGPTSTTTATLTPTFTPMPTFTATFTPTPPAAAVRFSSTSYFEDESQAALITLERVGDLSGTTVVNFFTANGTAVGGGFCSMFTGPDYVAASQTVTFNPGETSRTVGVTLCGDGLPGELDETVNLLLTGAAAGSPSAAVLTINDTATQKENLNPIAINSGGAASLYPSTINVTGWPTVLGSMRVTIYDYSTTVPTNVSLLLVGPGGQKFVLMANAGGLSPGGPATLTFSDTAGQIVPFNGPIATGDVEPTTFNIVAGFPAPAPPSPYNLPGSTIGGRGSQMMGGNPDSVFAGIDPNGVWSLYVREQAPPPLNSTVVGNIAGWGIEFINATSESASISGRVMTADGQGIRNATVVVTGNLLPAPIVATTGSFGYFTVEGLRAGETYVLAVNSRRYTFSTPTRVITLVDNVADADFVADP
jgi:CSLREA domain-containing protein